MNSRGTPTEIESFYVRVMKALSSTIFCSFFLSCACFTHWIVTEDGKIEYQNISPYNLRQPFDLMALINQEQRVTALRQLRRDLIRFKNDFGDMSNVESFYSKYSVKEAECKEARNLQLFDFYTSTIISLEDKGISHKDYLHWTDTLSATQPNCTAHIPLPFSMNAFDHLDCVRDRASLSGTPELRLMNPFQMQLQRLGGMVEQGLRENATSWVLYTLGTVYWRIRGSPGNAIECARRALHYSPSRYQDISLLNLANILHRARHSKEAVIPLRVAISISPYSSILYYTLGNILASAGRINASAMGYKQALALLPSHTSYESTLRSVYVSTQCECNVEQAKREHTRKLKATHEKIDQFYDGMAEVYRHYRHKVADPKELLNHWARIISVSGPGYDLHDPDENSETNSSQNKQGQPNVKGNSGHDEERMKYILDQVASDVSAIEEVDALDMTQKDENEEEEEEGNETDNTDVIGVEDSEESGADEPQVQGEFLELDVPGASQQREASQEDISCSYKDRSYFSRVSNTFLTWIGYSEARTCPVDGPEISLPLTERDHKERSEEETKIKEPKTQSKYTDTYWHMEFPPYTVLGPSLEELVFPKKLNPPAEYDDPFWPTKIQCLELVESTDSLPRFTGTFLTPEARDISFKKLFDSVTLSWLPSLHLKPPRCTDIVELPFSLPAMDHLEGISDRNEVEANDQSAERGLAQLLVATVEEATQSKLTFEEAGMMMFAAMTKHGPNWALFNLASLYWRALGDGYNSIECLRRAIHFAPSDSADVGFIGLANTLHRHLFLDGAITVARAALDIRPDSPIGHYTLGGIYLTAGDLVATNLHLRVSLHIQPNFAHALATLKLVRCSLKFKEEQKVLEQKQLFLLAQQELMNGGKEQTLENLHQILLSLKDRIKEEVQFKSSMAGDDALRYLTRLGLVLKYEKQRSDDKEAAFASKLNDYDYDSRLEDQGMTVSLSKENKGAAPAVDRDEITKEVEVSPSGALKLDGTPVVDDSSSSTGLPHLETTPAAPSSGEGDIPSETMSHSESVPLTKKPQYTMEFMAKESAREEELRKRWPDYLPWPTLEDCQRKPPSQYMVFTSTWLSVTAKKVNISNNVDFNVPLDDYSLLPICELNFEPSSKTLNHLKGMSEPPQLDYIAEKGLEEVLCKLEGSYHSLEEMATRIKLSMMKNDTCWVLPNLAALYWRITGDGQQAIKCLKHALHHSPPPNRDVALVSLANVLYRSGYYEDATIAMQMALETSPNLVVNHFTMANILAAQGYYREAAGYYELVLYHQPEFGPASDRLRSVRCMIVLAENREKQQQLEHEP